MRTDKRDDGELFAVAGSSRWGKSEFIKQMTQAAPRAFAWDIRGEYLEHNYIPVKSIKEYAGLLREIWDGEARLAYWGSVADFQDWCILTYNAGILWPAVMIAEETSDVTNSSKAPPGWGDLIRKGLYYGNHIYASTIRPQESDKTVWGSATCMHVHGFVKPKDQEYAADLLGVELERVQALEKYYALERWQGEKEVKLIKPLKI